MEAVFPRLLPVLYSVSRTLDASDVFIHPYYFPFIIAVIASTPRTPVPICKRCLVSCRIYHAIIKTRFMAVFISQTLTRALYSTIGFLVRDHVTSDVVSSDLFTPYSAQGCVQSWHKCSVEIYGMKT